MINVTRLFCDVPQPADGLRYGLGHGAPTSAADRKPVVVWNLTRRCNLRCVHCYSDSSSRRHPEELDLAECRAVLDDLAAFHVPAVLFSGGEPTLHSHFLELCEYATARGLRVTVSTNGTRMSRTLAGRLKEIGVSYVGISLDGIGAAHDAFRGREGAFDKAVTAFRNCRAVNQKAGLRLTLTARTASELPEIVKFIERENIQRVCFYHLVPSGRGAGAGTLHPLVVRACLRLIAHTAMRWHAEGTPREVLTVDQPADGPFFWLMACKEFPDRSATIGCLLRWNGGGRNGPGVGLGNIDSQGWVHPDQFWQTHRVGNVREKPFSAIWSQSSDEILAGLRNRIPRLKGRCETCRFVWLCGGGFRARAWHIHRDPWAEDPGCHLQKSEIRGVRFADAMRECETQI